MKMGRLSRRLLTVGVASGLVWALVTAQLVILNGAWADLVWELPGGVRAACDGAAIAAGAAAVTIAVLLALRQRALCPLARRLDVVAGTGGQILGGVDLIIEPPRTPSLTVGLAELAIKRAAQLVDGIDSKEAIPLAPVRRSGTTLCALGAGLLLAALVMPRLALAQWLRFIDPFGDHPPYSRVEYVVEPGDTTVVYGRELEVRVQTKGAPVDRLDLALRYQGTKDDDTLPLFAEQDGTWKGTVASVTMGGQYFVRGTAGRSRMFRITVITVPRFEEVRFRISPPAYTNRAAYEGPVPEGGLAGLPGTRVQVWVRSNRPLSGGSLEIPAESRIRSTALVPDPDDRSQVTGSFEIRKAGRLHLSIKDVAGQASTDTFVAPISVLVDERPFVWIMEPPEISFATPSVALPVVLSAEDDYGLSRIQLFRSLNQSRALPVDISIPTTPPLRWTARIDLLLDRFGLKPGDEIRLFGRAEDNDPAGPKGAESGIVTVRIISQEEFEQLVRAQRGVELLLSKYQGAQRRLEALKSEIDRLQKQLSRAPKDGPLRPEDREALLGLSRRLRAEAEAIRKSSHSQLPYALDHELNGHLEEASRALEDLARQAEALANRPGLNAASAMAVLESLLGKLEQEDSEYKRQAVAPLEQLAAAYPLMEDAARFVLLYQRQRSLAERLQSLRNPHEDPSGKARIRDLQVEQQQIRQDLDRLLEDIDNHVTSLPDKPEFDELRRSAAAFARDVRQSSASEVMVDAETALGDFVVTNGRDSARRAADILEKFIKRCKGADSSIDQQARRCLKFQPALMRALESTLAQLQMDGALAKLAGMSSAGGAGSGGGYSSSRSSLESFGLYGIVPGLTERAGNHRSRKAQMGLSKELWSGPPQGSASGLQALPPASLGAAAASVPAQYRQRVAEYFRRIADETGGK
jgi:hypothetical protein